MLTYIGRRLLLMIPTLFGILLINFCIVQVAPGGPVEQMIYRVRHGGSDATSRVSGVGQREAASGGYNPAAYLKNVDSPKVSKYRGAQGLDPELIEQIEKQFGF